LWVNTRDYRIAHFVAAYPGRADITGRLQHYSSEIEEIEQRLLKIVLDIANYLNDIGTDLGFLRLMFRAGPHEMNYISKDEALRFGIKVWDEYRNSWMAPPKR
jgi:hypothetical protein